MSLPLENSKIYYAILKRSGKQIKRSLKTTDQALAKRRLAELTEKAAHLARSENAHITFPALAHRWLEVSVASTKPSSRKRYEGITNYLSKA